jgi:RimJ/RimL family protein N-acetyltransferase
VLRPTFPIETERLLLRPFTADDLDWLEALHSDPAVFRYLPFGAQPRGKLAEKPARIALEREGDALNLAAVLRATGERVGDVSLFWRSEEHRQGEVGYILDPAQQGRGYATEAARALLALGFDGLGLHRITGRIDARNTGSARVLERVGMRREGQLVENERIRGEWTDEVIYAMLDREWAAG